MVVCPLSWHQSGMGMLAHSGEPGVVICEPPVEPQPGWCQIGNKLLLTDAVAAELVRPHPVTDVVLDHDVHPRPVPVDRSDDPPDPVVLSLGRRAVSNQLGAVCWITTTPCG
jgi:hypothetical protein